MRARYSGGSDSASWSKAIYAYAKAAMMYEAGQDPKTVGKIMAQVPDLMQRIAGKSIPLEKFVARKAKSASDECAGPS